MINDILRNRWSPYSFSSEPVDEEELVSLFVAAGLAPSSNNEQPWLFVYTSRDDEPAFRSFLGFLAESNRIWALNSWALAISLARLTSSYNGKPNRFALYDTGMAVANLLVQATSMGLYVHQMGGFSVEMVKEYFNLSVNIEPVAIMAIGNKGDGSNIPPDIFKRDEKRRPRKAVSEYTFRNSLPREYSKS